MSRQELEVLKELEGKLGGEAEPRDENVAVRSIDHAVGHVFERRSVVPQRTLLRAALRHSVGQASVEQVHERANRAELIVGERLGRPMVTTREVLAEERRMVEFARQGRGTCQPLVRQSRPVPRDWLNADQKQAVKHIIESRDAVVVVRGAQAPARRP